MSFEVIKAGVQTTIQDFGRYGYMKYAITNSGALDEYAYLFLNRLLENSYDTNSLEIIFGNIKLLCKSNTTIALTGAECEFYINNKQQELWQTYQINSGDTVEIRKVINGKINYLGVKNGFEIDKEFASTSTNIRERIGGLNSRALKKNDILKFKEYNSFSKNILDRKFIPKYEKKLKLRVIKSYQYENFSKYEINKFCNTTFTITNHFDRMGCRLESNQIIKYNKEAIISEPISFGAIQIPPSGNPIILLKDRQSIGGYPKIGTLFSIDCFKLSQANFNDKIEFEYIDLELAQKKLRKFYTYFKNID